MADIVSRNKRSQMMAGIRDRDTKPELFVRKLLFNNGYRYRLHNKSIPGNPDIVLKKYIALIFINGCFWHKHNCHLFKWPKTNIDFWNKKLAGNLVRDKRNLIKLKQSKWRVLIIWECAIKGKNKIQSDRLFNLIENWLNSDIIYTEISGNDIKSV